MTDRYDAFHPGQVWLDTEGKRIHAHGGSVFYEDGVYYWYGENKDHTDGKNGIWTWGVRCYKSTDLYNWEDLGLIIEPDLEDENSSLSPTGAMLDRPHIIFNKETKKYVCWMKIMNKDGTQTETVMIADKITGPYELVRENLKPLNMSAGDFDLVVAEDGKAYYYFERVHSETICADLTPDYTDVTGYYSTHFPHTQPPFVREATAHFMYNGKHYLVTSGTSGYLPNPSEVAVADTWHGPYTVIGNPHVNDESMTSYHSQISSVFKVPGKHNLYIACADRWVPDQMHLKYEDYGRWFELRFNPETQYDEALTAEMEELAKKMPFDSQTDTSKADYVWLPLQFVEPDEEHPLGQVIIEWKGKWRLSDYE